MHVHVVDECVRFLVALWQIIIEYMPQTCYTGYSTSPPSPSRASPKSTPATCSPETGHPVIQVLTQVKINQYYIYVLVLCLHPDSRWALWPFYIPTPKTIFFFTNLCNWESGLWVCFLMNTIMTNFLARVYFLNQRKSAQNKNLQYFNLCLKQKISLKYIINITQ